MLVPLSLLKNKHHKKDGILCLQNAGLQSNLTLNAIKAEYLNYPAFSSYPRITNHSVSNAKHYKIT